MDISCGNSNKTFSSFHIYTRLSTKDTNVVIKPCLFCDFLFLKPLIRGLTRTHHRYFSQCFYFLLLTHLTKIYANRMLELYSLLTNSSPNSSQNRQTIIIDFFSNPLIPRIISQLFRRTFYMSYLDLIYPILLL